MILKDILGIFITVLPLAVILLVLKLIFRPTFENTKNLGFGLVFVVVGLFVFLKGVEMCFMPMAKDVGESLSMSGLMPIFVILICAVIGFASTLVEPALKVLAKSISDESGGLLPAKILIYSTATGVAVGMALGVVRLLYRLPGTYIIVPLLVIALVLCFFVKKEYITGMAFDLAAATTGPVNIPINAAIALGLASGFGLDPLTTGFGLVGLTCLCSIIAVLVAGVFLV